jgi:hypothetical protein
MQRRWSDYASYFPTLGLSTLYGATPEQNWSGLRQSFGGSVTSPEDAMRSKLRNAGY